MPNVKPNYTKNIEQPTVARAYFLIQSQISASSGVSISFCILKCFCLMHIFLNPDLERTGPVTKLVKKTVQIWVRTGVLTLVPGQYCTYMYEHVKRNWKTWCYIVTALSNGATCRHHTLLPFIRTTADVALKVQSSIEYLLKAKLAPYGLNKWFKNSSILFLCTWTKNSEGLRIFWKWSSNRLKNKMICFHFKDEQSWKIGLSAKILLVWRLSSWLEKRGFKKTPVLQRTRFGVDWF